VAERTEGGGDVSWSDAWDIATDQHGTAMAGQCALHAGA
jgi:hypothetical protein